ncbi:helix-turn-helix domain-containing protein [Sphingobacterium phlebotomi]|uniref:Helix-turn-helix domain-containing protein n=1 Tax=Sphingobacterium phlebotomi TaxID=2605433 RepID=A0A5D4H832_9SPHI|nr:helix-turn-helix domain-containing protein [Sphingobacterium phlebotomi]TYR36694.1 helix-turn-helix domain-containing protein [Sphingobacterium phlebotomi]
MKNNELKNGNCQRPAGKCVQCAILLAILKALHIDVELPQNCTAAPKPHEMHLLLTRKEVMGKLNIKDSTYTRWVDRGILVPRIMGTRHFYTEDDLGRAFEESKRKGKR